MMVNVIKKSLSVLLAVVMVFCSAPLNGFVGLDLFHISDITASAADVGSIELLDGKITKGELYSRFKDAYGEPYNGTLYKGFYYTDSSSATLISPKVTSADDAEEITLKNATYNVFTGQRVGGFKELGSFQSVVYYNPKVTYSGVEAADVSLTAPTLGEGYKVYAGENVVSLKAKIIEGYTASFGENPLSDSDGDGYYDTQLTITSSDTFEVVYEKIPDKFAKVNLTVNGNGTVEGIENGSDAGVSKDITFTAVPSADYYISSITVNGEEKELSNERNTTVIYTVLSEDDVNIVVNFEKYNAPVNETVSNVYFNPTATISIMDKANAQNIAKALFDAVVPQNSGVSFDLNNIKYKSADSFIGFEDYNVEGISVIYKFNTQFAPAMRNGASEETVTVEITFPESGKYPKATVVADVLLLDSREDSGISVSPISNVVEFTAETEVSEAVKAAISNPNSLEYTLAIKKGSALPGDSEVESEVTYTVTFGGNSTYKPFSADITLKVLRLAKQCDVAAAETALANGKITVNANELTSSVKVDGKSDVSVSVTPDEGYAVRLFNVKDSKGNIVSSSASYSNKVATVSFKSGDGESYTVYAEYVKTSLTLKAEQEYEYCDKKQYNKNSLIKLVLDSDNSIPKTITAEDCEVYYYCLDEKNSTVEGLLGIAGLSPWVSYGTELSSIVKYANAHDFGEKEYELIKVVYSKESAVYGELSAETTIKIVDPCYNNKITVEETGNDFGGSTTISSAEGVEKIKIGENYLEYTTLKVTVKPCDNQITLLSKTPYVKSVVVTDEDGNTVSSDVVYEAGSILNVPTASVEFRTESNKAYTVNVEYAKSGYVVNEEDVSFDMYAGVEGKYESVYPSKKDIFNSVIKSALPSEWSEYDENSVTVEYADDLANISYKDADGILSAGDSTVKIKITRTGDGKKFQTITAEKNITLKDPRIATEIKYTSYEDAVEFVDDSTLVASLKEAMGFEISANGEKLENAQYDVTVVSTDKENNLVTISVSYDGNESYKPSSVVIENISVKDIPDNAEITVEGENCEVTIGSKKPTDGKVVLRGEANYDVVVKPSKGYAVEEIIFEGEDGKESLTLSYSNQAATAKISVKEKKAYKVKVVTAEAVFTLEKNVKYPFCYGYDTANENAIYDAAVISPKRQDNGEVKVLYLAREKSTHTVIIPGTTIGGIVIDEQKIDVPLSEKWLELDAQFENTDNVYDTYFGCHRFGEAGDGAKEKIKLSYKDSKYDISETVTEITLFDNREEAFISSNDSAEVYYGFNESELLTALNAKLTDKENNAIEGEIKLLSDINLNASKTPYDVTLSFEGNRAYKPCEKTVSVTVNKAPVTVSVPSQTIKYGESYEKVVAATDPKGVATIDFMAGIDVKDSVTPYIHLRLPGTLGEIYKGEMSLKELKNLLLDLIKNNSEAITGAGFDKETVDMLISALERIEDYVDFSNVTVKLNGSFAPENIGVYVIGSVTADSNYETKMAVGYLVVTPATTKVELAWAMDFEEGILTLPAVKKGIFDFEALAINSELSEAELENARKSIKYTFTGVDKDGLALDSKTPIKLNGAYTQIAYIADWDNEFFYALPIMRAYVIAPEDVKVSFVDENGEVNKDRVFTYDNTPHSMTAQCTDRQGNIIDTALNGALSYRYVGADANVQGYNSTEPPVNAGAYTVTAVYVERDEDGDIVRAGMDIGAMVIEKTQVEINIENKEKLCDEEDPQLSYTVSGLKDESVLNVELYREEGDEVGKYEIFAKYNKSNFYDVTVNSGSLTVSHNSKKYTVDEAVAPECEKTGLTEGAHCEGCSTVFVKQETVAALGHDYRGDVVSNGDASHSFNCKNGCNTVGLGTVKNAFESCNFKKCKLNEEGTAHTQECKTCSFVRTNGTEKDEAIAPDCTNTGLTEGTHCAVCDEVVIAQETVAKLGHDFAEGVVTEPTCTVEGYTTHSCKRENCGYSYYDTITEKLDHSLESVVTKPTCEKAGFTTHTCKRDNCGYTFTDTVTNPIGHVWGDWYISVAATNTEKGEKKRECANCDEFETCVLPEICHKWNSGEIKKEATCKDEGIMVYTCVGCENCEAVGTYETTEVAIPKEAHSFVQNVNEATCTESGSVTVICENCDYVASVVKLSPKSHILQKESTVKATCTSLGSVTYKCKNCEYKEVSEIDMLPHEYVIEVSYVAPSNEKDGNKVLKCKHCEDTTTIVLPALKHNFKVSEKVDATCEANGYTVYKCSNCDYSYTADKVNALGHSFTNYVSNDDATCTQNGTKTAKCDRCDKTDTKIDENTKKAHSITTEKVNATCEANGYTVYKCSNCDYSYTADKVNALGHSFTNYVSNGDATCTQNGTKTAKCDRCDKTDTKIDENTKKAHSITTEKVNATCEANGYTVYKCSNCDYSYTADKVNALGHSFANYVSNGDATCTQNGTKTAKCDRCDKTDTKIDENTKKAHSITTEKVNATCEANGYTGYKCSNCDYSYTADKVNALGHSFTNYVSNGDATCTQNGTKTAKCDRCDKTDTKIDKDTKKAHSITTEKVNATCEANGYTVYKCSNCDYSYTADKVNALGHSFTNYVSNGDATCTQNGTKTAKCDRCDKTDIKRDSNSALGHKIKEDKAVEPTCTQVGLTAGKSCERCNTVIVAQRIIEAKGHKTVASTVKATTKADGSIKSVCSVCKKTVSISAIKKVSSITLKNAALTYTGKAQKPEVIVKDSGGKVLVNGTDYTVSVKSRKKIGSYSLKVTLKGKYSGTKTLKYKIVPKAVENFQITNVKYSLKLNWGKVKNADGYRVYLYDSKTKKYTKVKDVKETKLIIKGLKISKKYTYAVRAYKTVDGKKYFSDYSQKITSAVRTKRNKITSVKQNKNGSVTLKWTKAKYATKYAIYVCETKHGEYKRIQNVYGADKTSATIKGLKKNKTYYFRVKSYRKVGGKNIYSYYSQAKKITLK